MELSIEKNESRTAKQELEFANMEQYANETIEAQMNETIEILKWRVEAQGSLLLQIKDIADKLLEKVESGQAPLVGKKDIMKFFGKESDFALRFLRTARLMGYGIKVGKEYYIKREEFEKILKTYQGLELEI